MSCDFCDVSKEDEKKGHFCNAVNCYQGQFASCDNIKGYEVCGRLGDILTEDIAESIEVACVMGIRQAVYDMSSLVSYLWDEIAQTDYPALYEIVTHSLYDSCIQMDYSTGFSCHRFSVGGSYAELARYNFERPIAAGLDNAIMSELNQLNYAVDHAESSPSGANLVVSADDLGRIVDVTYSYHDRICAELRCGRFGGIKSKYAGCAIRQMNEVADIASSMLDTVGQSVRQLRDKFMQALGGSVASATRDNGHVLDHIDIEWRF